MTMLTRWTIIPNCNPFKSTFKNNIIKENNIQKKKQIIEKKNNQACNDLFTTTQALGAIGAIGGVVAAAICYLNAKNGVDASNKVGENTEVFSIYYNFGTTKSLRW